MDSMPWTEKHRAAKFSDLRGQDLAIDKIRVFLREFPKKKAVILHGPPGTGKTSLAYAVACELDAEILELNASDLRDKARLAAVIGQSAVQMPLFRKTKIILVDEVDGISAREKGGLSELLAVIEKTAYPMIITANDIWQQKFNLLRRQCELVQFKQIDYRTILDILKKVIEREKCSVNSDVMTSIAIRARGDVRAALNDLQMLSRMNEPMLVKELNERNKEETIFAAMQYVFKNANLDMKMIEIFEEVNMPIEEIFLWVEENIPMEYRGEELWRAFDALSKADVFRGRIFRHQYWRFLTYEYFLLSAGVAAAKKYGRSGWTSYKRPTRVLKIWLQNQRSAKKKSICEKYAKKCHTSVKRAMKDFMLLRMILQNPNIAEQLKLSSEEMTYLRGS